MRRETKHLFIIMVFLLAAFVFNVNSAQSAEVVKIPDPGLEEAIRDALNYPSGEVTTEMMADIQSLDASDKEIADLSGIEYAVELQELYLRNNQIEDLSALNLPKLKMLDLGNNQIKSLGLLSETNLPGLEQLGMVNNQISDFSGVADADLPSLKILYLAYNQITGFSGLDGVNLPNLEILYLQNNQIDSFSGLAHAELPELTLLILKYNKIADLAGLSGVKLPALQLIELDSNQVSDLSGLAGAELPNLWGLGLSDNQIASLGGLAGIQLPKLGALNLRGNKLSDLSSLVGLDLDNLEMLLLDHNIITDISGIKGLNLPILKDLNLSYNQIKDITALGDAAIPQLNVLELGGNYLNISDGTPAMTIINDLLAKDIFVNYKPQIPFYGDVNKNGVINVADAILVLRHIVNADELTPEQLERAKVYNGVNLSVSDAILILRYIVGLDFIFPVEKKLNSLELSADQIEGIMAVDFMADEGDDFYPVITYDDFEHMEDIFSGLEFIEKDYATTPRLNMEINLADGSTIQVRDQGFNPDKSRQDGEVFFRIVLTKNNFSRYANVKSDELEELFRHFVSQIEKEWTEYGGIPELITFEPNQVKEVKVTVMPGFEPVTINDKEELEPLAELICGLYDNLKLPPYWGWVPGDIAMKAIITDSECYWVDITLLEDNIFSIKTYDGNSFSSAFAESEELKDYFLTLTDLHDDLPNVNFLWPVESPYYITSPFGWRTSLFTGETQFHGGIDIGTYGHPNEIYAAESGTVLFAHNSGDYGKYILIDHGGGMMTLYAHLSIMKVEAGEIVNRGDTIGRAGDTGVCNEVHLHFEVWFNGTRVDPLEYFTS